MDFGCTSALVLEFQQVVDFRGQIFVEADFCRHRALGKLEPAANGELWGVYSVASATMGSICSVSCIKGATSIEIVMIDRELTARLRIRKATDLIRLQFCAACCVAVLSIIGPSLYVFFTRLNGFRCHNSSFP